MRRLHRPQGKKNRGMTLVELVIAMAIVGILAALAIPVFSGYIREADLSEAVGNLQGILEAEQAYFSRFQRYTTPLPECPGGALPKNNTIQWAFCTPGWQQLGWSPDESVSFHYQVFSGCDAAGNCSTGPVAYGGWPIGGLDTFGVKWADEFSAINPQAWCAAQAIADVDGDGRPVYMRTNSYNSKIYRYPNPEAGQGITY